jgi:hypothetical protein
VSRVRLLLLDVDAKDDGWERSIWEVREEDEEDEDGEVFSETGSSPCR